MRRTRQLPSLLTLVAVMGWSAQASAEADSKDERIYGGMNAEPCTWPSTVSFGGCTGTLVHPEVVIYAAHCGAGQSQVYFGETAGSPARTVNTVTCQTHPEYGQASGRDHAFCILQQPVYDVPIVPILMGCEVSALQPNTEVVIVGFGQSDLQPDYGIKRVAYPTFNGISGDEANIGGGGIDACFGDSGGPAFVKLASDTLGGDDTWRVFGIVSYGAQDCLGPSFYSMMHIGMQWFEGQLEEYGIDITPCHNDAGEWEPTPLCQGFPMDPETGYGDWSNGCSGGPKGPSSAICGNPFDAVPDDTPPVTEIVSPAPDSTVNTDPDTMTAPVTISATAADEGWGVMEVELLINGSPIPNGTRTQEPWEWDAAFPAGGYILQTRALDWAELEGLSEPVALGIDQDPPEIPDPPEPEDEGGDSGTDDGGTEDDGGTDESGGSDTGAAADDPKGCACDVGDERGGSSAAWSLLALGLFARRRRRRAA